MATLVGNPKYGPGHRIMLKASDKLSFSVRQAFQSNGYQPNQSVFDIAKVGSKLTTTITLSKDRNVKSILLKDQRNKIISVVGTEGQINGSFNHYSKNPKSETGELTKLKEEISMGVFSEWIERRKEATEDQVIELTEKLGLSRLYDSLYYESAVKQLSEIKKIVKGNGFTYERQGEDKTKWLYSTARKLSNLSNDNWNPADIWIIDKGIKDFKDLLSSNIEDRNLGSIEEINNLISTLIKQNKVYPISLKQVTGNRSVSEIVSAESQFKVTNMDFSFDKVDLSDSFNNFILFTKSSFAVRVGFKASATTLNVSAEGRMTGAGAQIGGVDAKAFTSFMLSNFGYQLRSGNKFIGEKFMKEAKSELQRVTNIKPRFSNTITSYKEAIELFDKGSDLTKNRFANLISYLFAFLAIPKNTKEFEEIIKFCYYSSKKISTKSCPYILIK